MSKIDLCYRYDGSVACITLNDGKGNVLDSTMMAELQSHLESFRAQSSLKAILFQGEGKHFSFGASVAEHQREQASQMLSSFHRMFYILADLSIPTVAMLSGQCLGGGMELAIMCNIIFADTSAKMGQPEIVLGVFPPPASLILPMKIGQARADALLMTGMTINAHEAQRLGLVEDVFESRDVMSEAVDAWLTTHIIPKSATSLRYACAAARRVFNQTIFSQLPALQDIYIESLMQTHDANEGIVAFLEKRQPEWKNN